ncbi:MAG TPA: type VI secretion system baseplate subunit TssK [Sandaracinaceae bacterium LLY-WYZ-13_1]|nr:type VI secretion system baseplate subunit TssK [Sandaracinaceae bacterium LLY-WYZ-13_1]
MKTPLRVVWSEGLLMSPQHMQQADLYHEHLLGARLDALEPLNWGVVKLEMDRRALESGQVRVSSLRAVMPDGLVINCDSGDAELPPSRPVEGHFPHTQDVLEVYAAVPRERDGVSNYAEDQGGRHRYVIANRTVPDLTGDGSSLEVSFGQRNVQVLFGDEPKDDFIVLKIAEITRDASGNLALNDPYIPPILQIEASPFILAGMRRILRLMSTRRRSLAEAQRERGDATVEYNAGDITRFLLLNAINSYLPIMNHLVDMPEVPPRVAYMWMITLGGQLATFSAEFDPANLPKFNHNDLRSTFEPLFARITELLQATVKEHYVAMPLDGREDGMYLGQLTDDRLIGCSKYLIGVRSQIAEQEVANTLPRLSKMASWGDINSILSAATPGAAVEVTYRPPPEIPVKAGVVYFVISTDNNYWRNIINDRQIALYLPRPFDPQQTKIELMGVPRKG